MHTSQIDLSTQEFDDAFVDSLATAVMIFEEVSGVIKTDSGVRRYLPFGNGNRLMLTEHASVDLIGRLHYVILQGMTTPSFRPDMVQEIVKDPALDICMTSFFMRHRDREHERLAHARMADDGGPTH